GAADAAARPVQVDGGRGDRHEPYRVGDHVTVGIVREHDLQRAAADLHGRHVLERGAADDVAGWIRPLIDAHGLQQSRAIVNAEGRVVGVIRVSGPGSLYAVVT